MPSPVVLTVGSLHYDIVVEADHLPARDETGVGSRWYPKFGGKGGNQAVAAQAAGATARMFGAVGADAQSRSFYLRVKGELRDALIALNFERLCSFL